MARESLRLRTQQSVQVRIPMFVAIAIAAATLAVSVPVWRVLAWALPMALMTQVNASMARKAALRVADADARELEDWMGRLWRKTVLNQAVMATAVWWIGYDAEPGLAAAATALQLIFIGGSLINASTHPPTVIAGAWVNLAISAAFWLIHSNVGLAMSVSLLGMGLVVGKASQRAAATFRESLRMRFENRELLVQLEQEKRAAEAANAAKSRFLAAASHDLRQPLHALLVFSSLLGRGNQDPAALIGPIREAAAALDKLFNGLLDISKLETGSIVPQFQAVNVLAMAQDLVREYSADCASRGLAIAAEGEVAWVLTDPFLLERILRNLVDNAVKYTPSGSIVLRIEPGASVVELSVRDTGRGIAPELRERIFEEYFQLDNPSRDPARGTGLGLAIVRRLAQLLEVPIEVQSQPGQGSVFSLRLATAPLVAPDGMGAPQADTQVPSVQGVHVWLVEDSELVQQATVQALQSWGCTVRAWPGMPADDASLPPPDALIVDFRLAGGASGLDVIRTLRTRWPALPAAIMTGDPAIERARLAGLHDVTLMQKPVLPEVLVKWLAAARSVDAHAPARGHVDGLGAALDAQLAVDHAQVGLDGRVTNA